MIERMSEWMESIERSGEWTSVYVNPSKERDYFVYWMFQLKRRYFVYFENILGLQEIGFH